MKRKRKLKKRYLAIPLLLLGIASASLIDFDLKSLLPSPSATVTSYVQDQGSIDVYFCPREGCDAVWSEFLSSANMSIHCALFELDLPSAQETLLRQSEKIEVKIVTDDEYLYEFNHSFVKTDSWGLMHNKFCVVDGKRVSTGSMNPTKNDAQKNNNNLLLIESPALARNYEEEFQELWKGEFKKGNPVKNPRIKIGEVLLENYFCPEDHCAAHVKEQLQGAQSSIYFMAFSFTHEGIANVLLLQHLRNVSIKGVMEARQVSKYSKFNVLQYHLKDIYKDGNPQNMHHKVFIIDNKTVITGSFNPTAGGDERNDENLLVIHDKNISWRFLQEFEHIYAAAINRT